MEPEIINGLSFYTSSIDWRDFMKLGELVDYLNQLKNNYGIYYPDDNVINLACNIIENLPDQQITVSEWLEQNENEII